MPQLFRSEAPRDNAPLDVMADAAVAAAQGKLQDLRGQVDATEREVAARGAALGDARDGVQRESPTDTAARALLAGQSVEGLALDEIQREYDSAVLLLPVLRRAADMRNREVKQEIARASRKICAGLKDRHREVVTEIARALIALGEALAAEADFRETLKDGGVLFTGHLIPMPLAALGDPRERYDGIARWLLEALERGLIEQSLIPPPWLRRWSL